MNLPRNSTCYHIAGPKTLRLSSTEIGDKKFNSEMAWGSNLQNIEMLLRKIYVPDKGKIFIQVDQRGAEALVVAYECKDGKYRKLFVYVIKLYCYVGLGFPKHWDRKHPAIYELAKTPIEQLKDIPEWKALEKDIKASDNNPTGTRYYYFYKQTALSANYGIRADTFRMNLLDKSGGKIVLDKRAAEEYLFIYRSLFPEIVYWNMEVIGLANKTKTLRNLFGFPYQITGAYKDNELIAWVPQSTVGILTSIAYAKLQTYIEDNNKDWDIMNNCHDSYLVQCPESDRDECAFKMREFINQDLVSTKGEPFKMQSEIKWGYNWSSQSEYNPNGLRELIL